jgi:hypothetical protein
MAGTHPKIGYPRLGFTSKRDLNSGKSWSKMDVRDLYASHAHGASINETAMFLCRSIEETAAKARAMGLKVRRKPTGRALRSEKATPRPTHETHRWRGRLVRDRVAKT